VLCEGGGSVREVAALDFLKNSWKIFKKVLPKQIFSFDEMGVFWK
jgi:hypothetical protein